MRVQSFQENWKTIKNHEKQSGKIENIQDSDYYISCWRSWNRLEGRQEVDGANLAKRMALGSPPGWLGRPPGVRLG